MTTFRLAVFFLCNLILLLPCQARPHQEWVELMSRVVENSTEFSVSAIPTPESFLGYEIGSKHIRHDELVAYARKLCELSPRFHLLELGKTYEGRTLLTVVVSKPSAETLKSESIGHSAQDSLSHAAGLRKQWLASSTGDEAFNNRVPSVAYFAYGVHGNEASPSNAAVLLLYLLAAAEGDWIECILDQSIILVDPCLNPDGYDRYIQWLQNNEGSIASSDPSDREHNERSPSSRTNHFGFDLNRDWLPAIQPETQARLKVYYEWLPNLVLDVHEMGASQSLFFQPGIEGRDHPATPPFVRDTTRRIAEHFSIMLNNAGERHFTNQRFDDFYPGKGSTFPDLHGGVGILIEQGSSAGLIQTRSNETRTFAQTVANPLRLSIAALSSLQREHRTLMEYQRQFYRENRLGDFKTHSQPAPKNFLVRVPQDIRVAREWYRTLAIHQIQMFELSKAELIDGVSWPAESTWVIPLAQSESRFLHAMIDRQKEFAFSKFYDVSAWSLADAFGLDWVASDSDVTLGPEINLIHDSQFSKENNIEHNSAPITTACSAMSVDTGRSIDAMALMQSFVNHTLPVRISASPMELTTLNDDDQAFSAGSIFMLKADQTADWEIAKQTFRSICGKHGFHAVALRGGLSKTGIDLGSSDLRRLHIPRVGIVLDEETNTNSAGSLWYVFDQVFQWPIIRVDRSELDTATLRRLDVLVFPDSNRPSPAMKEESAIQAWLLGGGHMIALGKSVFDVERIINRIEIPVVDEGFLREPSGLALAKFPILQIAKGELPGVLFRAELVSEKFKSPARIAKSFVYTQQGSFAAMNLDTTDRSVWKPIARLGSSSWLAGYLMAEDFTSMEGKSVIAQGSIGDGKVTLMTFDPTFRGYSWDSIGVLKSVLLSD